MNQLTPWFLGHIKPARPGVYQTLYDTVAGYQYWDGTTLFSDDFVYNARLKLDGDFPTQQERRDYAERLAERLNGAHYG